MLKKCKFTSIQPIKNSLQIAAKCLDGFAKWIWRRMHFENIKKEVTIFKINIALFALLINDFEAQNSSWGRGTETLLLPLGSLPNSWRNTSENKRGKYYHTIKTTSPHQVNKTWIQEFQKFIKPLNRSMPNSYTLGHHASETIRTPQQPSSSRLNLHTPNKAENIIADTNLATVLQQIDQVWREHQYYQLVPCLNRRKLLLSRPKSFASNRKPIPRQPIMSQQ